MPTYFTGKNVPGYLPESDSSTEFRTFEDAKSSLLWDIQFDENYAENEEHAEELSALAQDVNLWSDFDHPHTTFVQMSDTAAGYAYWIARDITDEESTLRAYVGITPAQPFPTNADGGYPIVYVTSDGEVLCADCVNDMTHPLRRSHRTLRAL
jgi:hypothetical protein